MGCKLSFFKFNNKSYKVSNSPSEDKSTSSTHQGQKLSSKEKIQNSGQKSEKSLKKNVLPALSNQSFIYKTVLETTVSSAEDTEEEARINAAEAPGPFEIETDLLSPEVEEAVIKIQANVRGYLTRKHRGLTPEPPTADIKSAKESIGSPTIAPISPISPISLTEILSPPPNFSDKPKNLSTTDNDQSFSQKRQKIDAERLEKKVNKVVNKPLESPVPCPIASEKAKQNLELSSGTSDNNEQSFGGDFESICPKNDDFIYNQTISSQRPLEIPSIETSEYNGPEEAAIKIQAAFRGYQVRKTISRETSPCQNRDDQQVVHLRGKDTNSTTQDHERESILVLDQLEECLSQELMKSTINTGDETSFSSYSPDFDLNASLQSDTSLQTLALTQQLVNDNSNSVLDLIDAKQPESTGTVDEAPFATIVEKIVPESVNNKQIVETIQTETPSISNVDQIPLEHPSADCLDNRDSLFRDQVASETRENVPVLFIPTDEKVNAITDDTLQTDPVLVIELDCKLDASKIEEPNPQLKDKRTEIIESHLMESSKEFNTTIKSFDNNDIQDSTERAINQPKEISIESAVEPLFFVKISPLTSSSSTSDNLKNDTTESCKDSEKFEQTIATIPDVSSHSPSSPLDKNLSDFCINTSDPVEDLKLNKLTKDDSFGSDILILGDEKSDILYDPFVDDLTENSTLLPSDGLKPDGELLPSTSFIDDNLIKSIVDDSKSTEESSNLYDLNLTMPTVSHDEISNTILPSEIMSENISEVKDDILVNLDDSDQDDDDSQDSQKRPVEVSKKIVVKHNLIDATISSIEPDKKQSGSNTIESQSIDMNQTTVDNEVFQIADESFENNAVQDATESTINQPKEIATSEPEIEPLCFDMILQLTSTSSSDNQKNDINSIETVSTTEEQQNTQKDRLKVERTHDDVGATLSTEKSEMHLDVDPDFTINTEIVHEKVILRSCELQKSPINPFLKQSDFEESEKLLLIDQKPCNDNLTTKTNETQTVLSQNLLKPSQEPRLVTESEKVKSPEIVETTKKSKDLMLSNDIVVEPAGKEKKEKKENSVKTTDIESFQEQVKDDPSSSTAVIQSKPSIGIELTSTDVKSRAFENSPLPTSESANTVVNQSESSIKSSNAKDNGNDLKVSTNNDPSTSDDASKIKVEEAEAEAEAEAEDEDEESRENSHLYLRLQNREVRSKSPNPFCRAKKRRNKKSRGGSGANVN